jgi:D-alanine-D-alanine ligase
LDGGCLGGYKDSGADLAYALFLESHEKRSPAIKLITPATTPDPSVDADWSFGDHKEAILEVIEKRGANVLWTNTNVHSTHALMEVARKYPDIMMVGQDPRHVDRYDDKAWVNRWLQSLPGLEGSFPQTWVVPRDDLDALDNIPLPAIIKPVRGRGSQGVALCHSRSELKQRAQKLWETGDRVLVEEFCSGEEITVTVLPPGTYDEPVGLKDKHWALPVVRRFDHMDGIMPYSGNVPTAANSCLVPLEEVAADREYERIQKRCELAGQAFGALATIRLDARRRGRTKSGMCS